MFGDMLVWGFVGLMALACLAQALVSLAPRLQKMPGLHSALSLVLGAAYLFTWIFQTDIGGMLGVTLMCFRPVFTLLGVALAIIGISITLSKGPTLLSRAIYLIATVICCAVFARAFLVPFKWSR